MTEELMLLVQDKEIFPLDVPKGVAVCLVCGGKLIIEDIDGWVEDEDDPSVLIGDSYSITCETEPDDIDSEEWRQWMDWHYDMPYVHWVPVHSIIKQWLERHCRFDK